MKILSVLALALVQFQGAAEEVHMVRCHSPATNGQELHFETTLKYQPDGDVLPGLSRAYLREGFDVITKLYYFDKVAKREYDQVRGSLTFKLEASQATENSIELSFDQVRDPSSLTGLAIADTEEFFWRDQFSCSYR